MNLIFPLIAVLFILCMITVHGLKKHGKDLIKVISRMVQISVTDRPVLSECAEKLPVSMRRDTFQSQHDMSISVTLDGELQKSLKAHSSESHRKSDSKKCIQSDLMVSVKLL